MTSRAQLTDSSAGALMRITSAPSTIGRQRIAQLVRQHRQELVLAAVDLLQRLGDALLRDQLAMFLLGALALGDHLGEHDDAADLLPGVVPGAHLPAQVVGGSVGPDE